MGGLGGAVGRQDVEAAPGSQPDFCPGAPAHPSHPLRGHPSIAADTNFSAFRAPQLLVLCGGFQSKRQLLAPGQADNPEESCWGTEQRLYWESRQTEKMGDWCCKEPSSPR